MKEITLEEMQQIEYELLTQFDIVCRKNGLRYYIDGGTLLGAVCYDGFIPWDDDIDLKMPRPDYEKLQRLDNAFPAHIELDIPNRNNCQYTFLKLVDNRTVLEEQSGKRTKITGIYIDILPMDGHPSDPANCKKHLARLSRLNSLFHGSLSGFQSMRNSSSPSKRIKGLLYRLIYSPWKLYQLLTRTAKKYSYDSSSQVGLLVEGDPIRERFEKTWLEPPAMLQFEGSLFPAPNAAEEHLSIFYRKPISRQLYYMNLPKIPSGHRHRVYWKESACQS